MRLFIPLTLALLSACASAPPETSTYLLRSETASTSGQLAPSGIALGDVAVAAYLDQPGLVLARGDGKINAARNFTWAEPLQVSLRRFLAAEISAVRSEVVSATTTAESTMQINVTIDQLHGDGLGAAVLVAFWDVTTAAGKSHYRFSQQQALSSDGYDALAQAEQALLVQFAAAVADSLAATGEAQQGKP